MREQRGGEQGEKRNQRSGKERRGEERRGEREKRERKKWKEVSDNIRYFVTIVAQGLQPPIHSAKFAYHCY